jgi:two-component system LytT family response regulator
MLNVIILDDEEHAIINLSSLLSKHENIKICFKSTSPTEIINFSATHDFDMLFLDIKMPGITGFDVLDKIKQIRSIDFSIVFLTAYNDFALKAIKYSAFDYLLKPVDEDELTETIQKYIANQKRNTDINVDTLLEILHSEEKMKINTGSSIEFINPNQIAYAKAEGNYTELILEDNSDYVISKTLKEFSKDVSGRNFVRVHKSYIINKRYLSSFNRKSGICTLNCKSQVFSVPVSTRLARNLI